MISISRSSPAVVGTVNNFAVDFASIIHLRTKGTGNAVITGIAAPADNFQCVLRNDSAVNVITLSANSSGSLAANRFRVASDVVLDPGDTCQLYYDVIGGGWNIITTTSGGGGFGLPITEANVTNLTADLAAKVTNNSNQDVLLRGNLRLRGPVGFGFAEAKLNRAGLIVANADSTITHFNSATATTADQNDAIAKLFSIMEDTGLILPIAVNPSLALFARYGYLWQDVGRTILAVNPGDRVAVWDSAIVGLPYAIQVTASKRPVLALNNIGALEVRSFDATSNMDLSAEVSFAGDCTVYAVGTEDDYSHVFAPYTGSKDLAYANLDNQCYFTASNGSVIQHFTLVDRGKLIARWRRVGGNLYFAAHSDESTIPGVAYPDSLIGALAGTITYNQIIQGTSLNSGFSALMLYGRDLEIGERARNERYTYGLSL